MHARPRDKKGRQRREHEHVDVDQTIVSSEPTVGRGNTGTIANVSSSPPKAPFFIVLYKTGIQGMATKPLKCSSFMSVYLS